MHVWESIVTARYSGARASMSRKKISTTIYITPEQNELLHLLHSRTKVPVAVYIREGIDLVLKKYEDSLPGQRTLEAAQVKEAARPAKK